MGRPNEFDAALFDEVMERLADGETLVSICASDDKFPNHRTIRRWVIDDVKGCSAAYTRAREVGIHAMVEETVSISDDTSRDTLTKTNNDGSEYEVANTEWIARSRLRVDTRKWLASKVIPKIYGERVQQDVNATHHAGDSLLTLLEKISTNAHGNGGEPS